MIDAHGAPHDIPVEQVDAARMQGFSLEGDDQRAQRIGGEAVNDRYSTPLAKVGAFAAGVNRAVTFGASDSIGAAIDPEQARHYRGLREANPGISTAGEIGGALLTALPTGGESIIGQAIARTPGGMVSRLGTGIAEGGGIGAAVAGAATEGALYGVGSGVSELALSDKPIDLERVASTLSSKMLYGGLIGGAAGSIGKVAEIGLSKARTALATREARTVVDDLATMDIKQLGVAKRTEIDAIKANHKLEVEALETTRSLDNKRLADEIKGYHREVKNTQWATTKDLKMPAAEGRMSAGQLGRDALKADNQLANTLGNPIGLAKSPTKALDALQRQEAAYVNILSHADDLKLAYATDALGGKRLAALEGTPALLEKNRALQERIARSMDPHPPPPTSSARLEAIEAAKDAMTTGGGAMGQLASVPQRMVEGTTFGAVASAVGGLAIPGAGIAAGLLGAAASKLVGQKLFGGLGKAATEQGARAAKAASIFAGKAEKAVSAGVPIATRVLASIRYGDDDSRDDKPPGKGRELAHHFAKRTAEIRSLVEPGIDGKPVMRVEARAKVAAHLAPIGDQFPMLADALEEIAARRVAFLADKMPKTPDVFAYQLGPSTWKPSDMEMRKFARYAAGVEDPSSIMDRVTDGSVSPEDAEVMREVYPEMLADLQQQIFAQAGSATTTIPYQRRLALSRLTGIPVDPTMDPRILSVIQAAHASEAGTDGGTQSPQAQPQFGSVSKQEPTPAQRRGQ